METRSEPEAGTESNVPAVLQLYSWSNRSAELPVSAFAKAAFSPSRELLLLQSRDREVILFPLGGRTSNAAEGDTITPNPIHRAPPPPPPSGSPPLGGHPPKSVSNIAEYASHRSGSSSSAPAAADNPLLQPAPSTSYSNRPQTLKTSPLNSSHEGLHPSPNPSLGNVDCFAWASHGDGFGSKGPTGWFKELLFTSNEEGLYIHGLSPKSIAQGGNEKEERAGFDANGRWREGKWREREAETIGAAGDSDIEVGEEEERKQSSSSGEKDGDKRIVSYVVDAELEDSAEGLQLRFDGPNASWPLSAEVVSFRFAVDSPSLSLLTSPKSRIPSKGNKDSTISAESSATGPESTEDSLKPEQEEAGAEDSPDHLQSIEIVDIISNPSQTLIGIVTCQRSSTTAEESMQDVSSGGDEKKLRHGLMGQTKVSIALVLEWSVKWVAAIDLNEGTLSQEGGTTPWVSLVLTNDRLLGLKQDGGIFVWAATSGNFIAFIDLVRYCGLGPRSQLGAKKGTANETEDLQQEKTKSVHTEKEPHALLNGESMEAAENKTTVSGNVESSGESKPSGGHLHGPGRQFTRLVATADSLLLAVTDDQGLLFVVSTDDYFVSQGYHSPTPSTNQKPFMGKEDLTSLSYWDIGGSDIGGAMSTTILPNRWFLKSVEEEIDIHGVHKPVPNTGHKISGGRESGPGPPVDTKDILQGPTGFTSRMEVRRGTQNFHGSQGKPIRRVFLPLKSDEALVAVALSFNAVTTMVRSNHNDEMFSITQNGLHILDGAVDERDLYGNLAQKMEGRVQRRSNYIGDVLPFCSQGFLYLLKASSLHVVLPPLALSQSKSAPSQLSFDEERRYLGVSLLTQNGNIPFKTQGMLPHPWQTEVIDRALVCDGLEEAELLCLENGWSLQLFHLRRLQLAVDFVRTQDVEQALEALAHVGAAESGVLCLLFAAVELMLNQHISDNELAQASKLLSSAASFTTRLVRQHGVRGWQSSYHQKSPRASLDSSRYTTSVTLTELARFLEVIRTLQVCLEEKRKGPNIKKGETGKDRAFASSEEPNVKAPLAAIEEGVEETIPPSVLEQGSGAKVKAMLSAATGVPSSDDSTALGTPSSSSMVPTGSFGGSWDVSPTEIEGGKRRRSHIESPGEMFSRWESENVDAAGVVRDALKSSGRLALAVAQLQRMRMMSARDNPQEEEQEDVFSELLRIGRGIVYELFCKGKAALAIAALRRLGEDIESALRDLALGTVGRLLHAQAVKELQRLMRLSASDIQLFERVSLIEKEYPNSTFWRTYEARRQQGVGASSHSPDIVTTRNEMNLNLVCDIFGEDGFKIECGEVDGVVLGPWSMIDDQPGVVDEELNLQDSNFSGYWAAAAVWLQPWDQQTVDRILLEPLLLPEQVISWEARLEFYVAHHHWQAVIHLLEVIPSSVQYEGMLHVHLDSDDTLSYDPSLPFSGVSDGPAAGSLRNAWLDDGETGEAVIPKVHILALDFTSVCNTSMWQIVEERLARNHIFLKEHWKGTVELMSLFARAGLLFHPYSWGRNTRSKDLTFPGPMKGSKLHKDAVFGVHELVVQHCLRQSLPHFFELYLDFHSLALDKGYSTIMQYLVGECQWALWLLYSGLQRREYDASFANALTILTPRRGSEGAPDDANFLRTVDDMAKAGGEIMALATLMYAPVLLQKCISAGHISTRHDRGSWQCTLESLQPGLQQFPTLWSTLVGVCFAHDSWGFAYGRLPLNPGSSGRLNQYLEWHQRLFSCARGDTSLVQMTPTWLPQGVKYLLQLTMRGPGGKGSNIDLSLPTAGRMGSDEELESLISGFEAAIQKTIEEELYAHDPSEDSGWDCQHHLRRGHAVAAFSMLLNSRVESSKDLKSGYGRLHSSEIQALFSPLTPQEENLIASVIPAVVMDFDNSAVVAAFALFVELCGLSANLLRVDIAALRRISSYSKSLSHLSNNVGTVSGRNTTSAWDTFSGGGDVTGSLAAGLADDYVRTGVSALSSFSADKRHYNRRSGKSYSTISQLLEKASLKDEGRKRVEGGSSGAWLFDGQGDGLLLRTMQWSASESWSLVTAFCRAHGLPFSTTYLEILARDNDWVGFLAEAQLEGCPLDLLLPIVSKEFTNPRLQSQLLFVLKNLPGGAALEKPAGVSASEYNSPLSPNLEPLVSSMSATAELFSLLADCEGSKHPGKDLLRKAKQLRWAVLAVVASCFGDVTPQACLTTWLEITVVKDASVTEITDGAAQSTLSARVAAAVDATNAGAGRDSISGFRYCRTSSSKRQRLSSEEAIPQADDVHNVSDEGNSGLTTDARAPQTDERAFPTGPSSGEGPAGVGAGDGGREQEESLAALVAILCEQQRFLPLLRAFELFTPTSSFLPFLRFLQAFSQMRISEASAHLASFTARLKEEMQQSSSRSSSRSGSATAWITRAAIAAADAMHGACPSAYERRCLLQLLSGSDFGDGGVAAMRYRRLYWKIQLAEPALQEGSGSVPVTDGANLDDKALFDTLEKSTQWEQARSWARQLDPVQSVSALHRVTETQAEAMVAEWKDVLWDIPEERVALWNHCQALFTMHAFPALKAGEFFLKHADALEPELSSSELHNILLVALQWLSGSITNSAPVYPLHLLHELETRVWLLAVESSVDTEGAGTQDASSSLTSMRSTPVGGLSHEISAASPMAMNFVDRTAATVAVVDSHLKRSSLTKFDVDEAACHWSAGPEPSTSSSPTSKPTTSRFKRKQKEQQDQPRRFLAYSPEVAQSNFEDTKRIEVQSEVVDQKDGAAAPDGQKPGSEKTSTGEEVVGGRWEERVGEGEVDRAVLTLLEVGQVTAAKLLQQKLSPTKVPLEFSLVEAGLKIAALSPLTTTGSAVSSAVPADVVEHLQNSGLVDDIMRVSAIDLLEKLTEACREGCGKGLCQRISAIAKIADVLGLTFGDAFAKSPTQLLQLLALKGQDALAEAKLLVATHPMLPASAARILAESFLKGLLAAHRGGYMQSSSPKEEGPAPLLWRPSDFIRWAQICTSEPEIGHALMRLVISGRDMPHACEVELIILAYRYYERSACLDGVDVLVALAATRVDSYLAEGDYSSLARLVTGISNFQALHFIIDFLIENGQLELLLQKRSAVDAEKESSASIRGFRMAVLSALKHFNPHDLDAFAMVYSNFSMAHEMASLLESRGRRAPEQWASREFDLEESEEFLDMMRFYVEAAKVYSGIDAGNKTTWCCAQASLISLQLRMPDHMWLNLSDTNARRLLVDQARFQESLIVAEAYGLNQSAEWVPVIWNQMLVPGRIDQFLNDFVAALPLTHSMLMELARFYRAEVSARGDQNQLDFSKWLTPGGIPVELARHLSKSFRSLLKHTRDMKERLQLATVATGFPDIVELCLKNIDNMPITAGPLILRRGHGGTYVPIM
ncbi:unnamed protein product [Calypogeia fissa]